MNLVVHGSRPAWGTPDFSPFVIKLETWLRLRWIEADGWAAQYPAFKVMMPALVAPIVLPLIRRNVRQSAIAQGSGRHSREDAIAMAVADLSAVEALLGEGPHLLGAAPRSVDATVYAFLLAIQRHPGDTAVHQAARRPALLAYTARISERYWPQTELAARA